MTHHPHVHMIVPGGGISADGSRWVSCRSRFFLPVRVLSRLFRRLFLQMLSAADAAGRLKFQGDRAGLADQAAFAVFLAALRKTEWVVYAKEPFGDRRPYSPICRATPIASRSPTADPGSRKIIISLSRATTTEPRAMRGCSRGHSR
jgi:Putative transposase